MFTQRRNSRLSCLTVLRNFSVIIPHYQSQRGMNSSRRLSQKWPKKVVGKRKPSRMPSWVSDRKLKLREERVKAKKRHLLVRTWHARQTWRRLNTSLNESYKYDEPAPIQQQMEDLQEADRKGDFNTTWKIINRISGQNRSTPKVKKRDSSAPFSDTELLAEWGQYFADLLNNDSGSLPYDLPPPADQDLPICTDPPPLKKHWKLSRTWRATKHLVWIVWQLWKLSRGWRGDGQHRTQILCWSIYISYSSRPVDHQRHCSLAKERGPQPHG